MGAVLKSVAKSAARRDGTSRIIQSISACAEKGGVMRNE